MRGLRARDNPELLLGTGPDPFGQIRCMRKYVLHGADLAVSRKLEPRAGKSKARFGGNECGRLSSRLLLRSWPSDH